MPTCALELQTLIEKECVMTSEAQMAVVNKFNCRMNINMNLPTCAACKSRRFDDGTDVSREIALSELCSRYMYSPDDVAMLRRAPKIYELSRDICGKSEEFDARRSGVQVLQGSNFC